MTEPRHCFACGILQHRVEPEAAVGPLTVSLYGECWWNGHRVDLTPAELAMVHALASSPGVFFKREALINLTGSRADNKGKVTEVLICRIRRKFEAVDPSFDRVVNAFGRGYCWRDDPPPRCLRLETAPV